MYDSRPSVVVLSRGSTWNPKYWDPPYTLPTDVVGGLWPEDATAQTVFYDTAGGVLATVDGTVTPGGIDFVAAPAVVDLVPNGASFEMFITVDEKPYQLRYGRVVRREAQFLQAQPAGVAQALVFADSWPTVGLRSSWLRMTGKTKVYDNSGASLPNGVGSETDGGFLGFGSAQENVIRWFRELNSNSVRVKVTILNQSATGSGAYNRLRVLMCADQYLSSGLGVEFADVNPSGTRTQTFGFVIPTSPTTMSFQGTPTARTLSDGETYVIDYDDTDHTLRLYAGADASTLLGSWTDEDGVVPHGPGYRHLALSWSTSANSDGLQVTKWQAMDRI